MNISIGRGKSTENDTPSTASRLKMPFIMGIVCISGFVTMILLFFMNAFSDIVGGLFPSAEAVVAGTPNIVGYIALLVFGIAIAAIVTLWFIASILMKTLSIDTSVSAVQKQVATIESTLAALTETETEPEPVKTVVKKVKTTKKPVVEEVVEEEAEEYEEEEVEEPAAPVKVKLGAGTGGKPTSTPVPVKPKTVLKLPPRRKIIE